LVYPTGSTEINVLKAVPYAQEKSFALPGCLLLLLPTNPAETLQLQLVTNETKRRL
jgi:hypothetical protein